MDCDAAWIAYKHDEAGFELALPTDWPVDDKVDGCALVCTEPPPAGGPPTYLPPSIVVTVDELARDEPFHGWVERFRASLLQTYSQLRIIDVEETRLGDVTAHRTLSHYQHSVAGGVCTDQWCIPALGHAYVITCSSGALEYDDFADTFQRVAAGFRSAAP